MKEVLFFIYFIQYMSRRGWTEKVYFSFNSSKIKQFEPLYLNLEQKTGQLSHMNSVMHLDSNRELESNVVKGKIIELLFRYHNHLDPKISKRIWSAE